MTKTITFLLAGTLTAFALVPATAGARVSLRVGIGDQQISMFDQAAFQRAKFKRVRYFVPWNVMRDEDERLEARRYIQRARQGGIQVLLHISSDDLRVKRARLPSRAEFRTQVRRLVPYFRKLGVREFGAWNEVNHASQPTYRSATRAAEFFIETYQAVKPRCSFCAVVALDVLDQPGVERYMRSWYRRLSSTYQRRATIVGIHNYGDVNRQRTTFTRNIIRQSSGCTSTTGAARGATRVSTPASSAPTASRAPATTTCARRCRTTCGSGGSAPGRGDRLHAEVDAAAGHRRGLDDRR